MPPTCRRPASRLRAFSGGYLVNGEARAIKPEVLRGDPKVVAEIIDSLPFRCRYTSGVLSFAAEDRVTPAMQEDIMNRFESAVFAGLPPDRRSIVWIKHADKGRTEIHFVVPRVDLGTGKSLNIAPPTPASRHLLDTLREAINRRYGFRDPSDPECARMVSLPAHVAKLAAQAQRLGRSAKADIREMIAEQIQEQVVAGAINSRADVVGFLKNQGFTVARSGVNYLTIVHPNTGERVRLKGNLFRENFCPRDLQRQPRQHDPALLLTLERRLERLVEKRASYHRARYKIKEQTIEPVQLKEFQIYVRQHSTPRAGGEQRVNPAVTVEAKVAEHERLPPRQLRPELWRLAARNPKADRSRDAAIVEAADAALPTPPRHDGKAMPHGGGLAGYEVAAHHNSLSSHE